MHAGRHTFQVGRQDDAVGAARHGDGADRGADAVFIDLVHRNAEVGDGLTGREEQSGGNETLRDVERSTES